MGHFCLLGSSFAQSQLARAGGWGASDITDLYTARCGAPKVATKVYVQVNQFVDGWESLPRTYSAIVPAS